MAQLNVLLVEDETEEKDFFLEGMQKLDLGHRTIWANNYTQMFELLKREPGIDLVVIDLGMPGKSGKECLKDLKAHETYKTLPVIIMTVSKNKEDIREVFENGAHYYAIKPYSQTNFLETLRQIFTIDWKVPQPVPDKKDFIINMAFA
jgi:DNA-binding response OmpR family regulator